MSSFEQSNYNILLRKSHGGHPAWQKRDRNLALAYSSSLYNWLLDDQISKQGHSPVWFGNMDIVVFFAKWGQKPIFSHIFESCQNYYKESNNLRVRDIILSQLDKVCFFFFIYLSTFLLFNLDLFSSFDSGYVLFFLHFQVESLVLFLCFRLSYFCL